MSEADPFAPADPIEAMPPPERVNYATGVLLDADDFGDEQSYHRGRLAAALRALAGFGTIAGLRVRPPAGDDAERELRVEPGLAIDRFGRLIELDAPYCIRVTRWFAAQPAAALLATVQAGPNPTILVDVFLSASQCARGKTPAFATGPFDALDAVVPSRLAEAASLELVPRAEAGMPPLPRNFWPASGAADADKLQAVLGSWNNGVATGTDQRLNPLQEHVEGRDPSALLLARITIPVTIDSGAPPGTSPQLDLISPVSVDNSGRPFVFLPGKWLGQAFVAEPLVQP